MRVAREQHQLESSNHSRYMKHFTRNRSQDHGIYIFKQIYMCTHTHTCTFHDVYCSKPLTFQNGFMFICFSYLFQALLQISKPSQVRATERKMSITRSGRQQCMCNVWHMIRKGNGRQPVNICDLILIILSKKKRPVTVIVISTSKNTFVCL